MRIKPFFLVGTVFSLSIFVLASSRRYMPARQDPWKAPGWADTLVNPYLIEPLTLPQGEEVYNLYCLSCHGEKGRGDGAAGGSLAIKPANFHDQQVQKQSNGALFWKISEGRGNMLPFKQVLSEEQRWQLVAYIRDITKPFHLQQNPFKSAISNPAQMVVKKTADFEVDGEGNAESWTTADWIDITLQESPNDAPVGLKTRAKALYSETGIYFLFSSEDQKITATIQEDFGSLFREDVVEVFLWPNPDVPIYFEYEISPLNFELPILVPNINGKFQGWKPLRYEGKSKTRHATAVKGGQKKSNANIRSWSAEIYIPYVLLNPIVQAPPTSGTKWRANLYRLDYDNGYTSWTWQKTTPKVRGSLHEFNKFGTLVFE